MDYMDVPPPNIAGAGNYAQMLQQGLSNLGKPRQQQQQRQPGTPNTPSGNLFSTPFLGGGTGGGQTNFLQQLLASLGGR
jgi:hypothetical protein